MGPPNAIGRARAPVKKDGRLSVTAPTADAPSSQDETVPDARLDVQPPCRLYGWECLDGVIAGDSLPTSNGCSGAGGRETRPFVGRPTGRSDEDHPLGPLAVADWRSVMSMHGRLATPALRRWVRLRTAAFHPVHPHRSRDDYQATWLDRYRVGRPSNL